MDVEFHPKLIAIVLVLPNVLIVSYGIAKRIREITRGSEMCHYLTINELIDNRMNNSIPLRMITMSLVSCL